MRYLNEILSLFVYACLLAGCKSVKIQEYFRTYDNEKLIYKFQSDSSGYITFYDDTLICKIIVRAGVFLKLPNENFDIFYFEKSDLPNSPKQLSPFNNFSYCFDKGNLYAGNSINRTVNPLSYSDMKLLIPNRIKKGNSFSFTGSDYKSTYTFLGFDDFEWHKLGVQKCLKFSINEVYSNKTYYIWLSKKWGLIKWIKPNGDQGVLYE